MLVIGIQVGGGAPAGGHNAQNDKAARGQCGQRQQRIVHDHMAEHGTGGQQLAQAADQQQHDTHAERIVEAVAQRFLHRLKL